MSDSPENSGRAVPAVAAGTMSKSYGRTNYAAFYSLLWPSLRDRAQELGYALAMHGSLARDFDLIAVPWTELAVSADELVLGLAEECGAFVPPNQPSAENEWRTTQPEIKVHGRRCWSICFGGRAFIDLSVMPRDVDCNLNQGNNSR